MMVDFVQAVLTGFCTGLGVVFANYFWERFLKEKVVRHEESFKSSFKDNQSKFRRFLGLLRE